MKKRGVTLIELIVAMTIFLVIITIAVGAFVTVSRMKALTSTMKESQQKTRIALEMISRLSRQAQKIVVKDSGDTLELYFDIKSTHPTGVRFKIIDSGLEYGTCSGSLNCISWEDQKNIYEGVILLNEGDRDSKFIKVGSVPPTLSIELYGKIGNIDTNVYYSDEININTTIILENIK